MTEEEQIRNVVKTWLEASRAGDTAKVLNLMTDDVIFLTAGRPPMDKAAFAAASTPPAGQPMPQIDGTSDIQEVQVCGDWAFLWSKLQVVITPAGAPPMTRAGNTLTIFKKENGQWLLARDANLLAPVKPAE